MTFFIIYVISITTFMVLAANEYHNILISGLAKGINYFGLVLFNFWFVFTVLFYLFKTQKQRGIISIETRSGLKPHEQFFLRLSVHWTIILISLAPILFYYIILDCFILTQHAYDWSNYFIWSNFVFLLLFNLIVFPITLIIILILPIVLSSIINLLVCIMIILAPLIQMGFVTNNDSFYLDKYIELNWKLSTANKFYSDFKDDTNVNFIFDDVDEKGESIFLNTIEKNYSNNTINNCGEIINMNLKTIPYYLIATDSSEKCYDNNFLLNSIYYGETHINFNVYDINQNDQKSNYSLENTSIFKIIDDIHNVVINNQNDITKQNHEGLKEPGDRKQKGEKNLSISSFINELNQYPEILKYQNLLNWIDKFYYDNNFLFDLTFSGSSIGTELFKRKVYREEPQVESNSEVKEKNEETFKLYEDFPELKIINWLLIQLYLNTYTAILNYDFSGPMTLSSYSDDISRFSAPRRFNFTNYLAYIYIYNLTNPIYADIYNYYSEVMHFGISSEYDNLLNFVSDNNLNKEKHPITPIFINETINYISFNISYMIWIILFEAVLLSIISFYFYKITLFL